MTSPLLTPVMTLPEYAKAADTTDMGRALIEMFAESSDIAKVCPFLGLSGFIYQGFRQASLQTTMAFRAINASSTSGAGTVTPFQESTFVIDHDIPVDRVLVDRGGDRRRAWEEKMAMARLGELWVNTFLKGDSTITPTVFNGLQKRSALYGRNIDNASGIAGGNPLSFTMLDWAIQNVKNPTHIIVPWSMKYRFIQAARNPAVTGYVIHTSLDESGKAIMDYAGLPLLFGYEKDLHLPILPFTEVATGGGAAQTSSIYVVSFGENNLVAIQNKPMEIRDFGLLEDGITYNTHVSWDIGLVDNSNFCFSRLSGVLNAPFTV